MSDTNEKLNFKLKEMDNEISSLKEELRQSNELVKANVRFILFGFQPNSQTISNPNLSLF
jgi:peptidoglycan hydrolase CwlO-like protein